MFKVMVAIASMVVALSTPLAASADTPSIPTPPDEITIDIATVNGSGCPDGTAAVAVSPDNEAFTVTYSDYLAQVGVGAEPTDFRKNCQISLLVHVPQGFTYAIAQADYRGFASLADGATGMEKASYYFQGMSETTSASHKLTGSFVGNWQFTDKTDVAALVYAPCGELRNFNINTELRVDAGTSDTETTTSFMTMDSTDGNIKTTYHFTWKRCP